MDIRRYCTETRYQYYLVAAALFAIFLWICIQEAWGDVDHYWVNINEVVVDHRMPYSETMFEYPPLALLVFSVPRLFSWNLDSFRFAFAFFAGLTYLVSMRYAFRIGDRLGVARIWIFLTFFATVFWFHEFILARYDIYTVALILMAIDAFQQRKYDRAAALIGLATMLKVYPILILFMFLYPFFARREWVRAVRCIAIIALVCVIVMLPFMIYDMSTAFDWVSYHSNRGIQVESVIGTILEVGSYLAPGSVVKINNYGSDNITGDIPDAIAPYMNIVMAVSLVVVLSFIAYVALKKKHTDVELDRSVVMISLILILSFIVFNKVYSAQYGLWVVLLVPLLYFGTNSRKENDRLTLTLRAFGWMALIAALSYQMNIALTGNYDVLTILPAIELLKNVATVALFVLVLITFWNQFREGEPSALE